MTLQLRYIAHNLPQIGIAANAILAVMLWRLHRLNEQLRERIGAAETEQGMAKKRVEAATGGLHIRVLQVERRARQAASAGAAAQAAAQPFLQPAPPRTGTASAGVHNGTYSMPPVVFTSAGVPGIRKISPASITKAQLSRGEIELLRKIRQLSPAAEV
jgi:hypothetical protein